MSCAPTTVGLGCISKYCIYPRGYCSTTHAHVRTYVSTCGGRGFEMMSPASVHAPLLQAERKQDIDCCLPPGQSMIGACRRFTPALHEGAYIARVGQNINRYYCAKERPKCNIAARAMRGKGRCSDKGWYGRHVRYDYRHSCHLHNHPTHISLPKETER